MPRFRRVFPMLALLACFLWIALPSAWPAATVPKYVFLFIGDGMGLAQRTAAEIYLAEKQGIRPGVVRLAMSRLPVCALTTTHSADSLVTDSAAAGTALACGIKTRNGAVGVDPVKQAPAANLSETARRNGRRVGVITSVSLNHATPACFYSHQNSRGSMYDIAREMAPSGIEYFGGGGLKDVPVPAERPDDPWTLLRQAGYRIANTVPDIEALRPGGGRVFATDPVLDDGAALLYDMDRTSDSLPLAGYVRKGIEMLDNPQGFFLMTEGGRIDWACHAHDAKAVIHEVLAFDLAIREAQSFAAKHPAETLIVVTADHETGGMTLGTGGEGSAVSLELLDAQKQSSQAFARLLAAWLQAKAQKPPFEDFLKVVRVRFGLSASTPAEVEALGQQAARGDAAARRSLALSLSGAEVERLRGAYQHLVEKGGSPKVISMILTEILDARAGISWVTEGHTATPVPLMAGGAGQERFGGQYDNTEASLRLRKLLEPAGTAPSAARPTPRSTPAALPRATSAAK